MSRSALGDLQTRLVAARRSLARREELAQLLASAREQRARLDDEGGSSSELAVLEQHIAELEGEREALAGAEAMLQDMLAEKEAWMAGRADPAAEDLARMAEEHARLARVIAEIDSTRAHGVVADQELAAGLEILGNARGWGFLGGALLGTSMSHERVDRAKHKLEAAATALAAMQPGVEDIDLVLDVDIEATRFQRVGSYILGPIITGWASRINRTHRSVKECRQALASAFEQLEQRRAKLATSVDRLAHERAALIEGWGR